MSTVQTNKPAASPARLDVRLNAQAKEKIEQAAVACHQTVTDFVQALRRSQLLEPAQLNELKSQLAIGARGPRRKESPLDPAASPVPTGFGAILTSWEAEWLRWPSRLPSTPDGPIRWR